MWHMPLDDAYFSGMKSTIADMRNAGPRVAGGFLFYYNLFPSLFFLKLTKNTTACTAAIFLKQYIENDVKWAHLDIAGVMHSESNFLFFSFLFFSFLFSFSSFPFLCSLLYFVGGSGYNPKGMTGTPTRTLLKFALDHASEQ